MGTNYYVAEIKICPNCNHELELEEGLHIGKSSAGWCFSLHVIPEEGLNSWDEWKAHLSDKRIVDEYGAEFTLEELRKRVEDRRFASRSNKTVPIGYTSWKDFHDKNHSQPGPNGLSRPRLGPFCTGHGEGTWDYMRGEFS